MRKKQAAKDNRLMNQWADPRSEPPQTKAGRTCGQAVRLTLSPHNCKSDESAELVWSVHTRDQAAARRSLPLQSQQLQCTATYRIAWSPCCIVTIRRHLAGGATSPVPSQHSCILLVRQVTSSLGAESWNPAKVQPPTANRRRLAHPNDLLDCFILWPFLIQLSEPVSIDVQYPLRLAGLSSDCCDVRFPAIDAVDFCLPHMVHLHRQTLPRGHARGALLCSPSVAACEAAPCRHCPLSPRLDILIHVANSATPLALPGMQSLKS
jgi:hypothetical protein